jgi:hypothetical protein
LINDNHTSALREEVNGFLHATEVSSLITLRDRNHVIDASFPYKRLK